MNNISANQKLSVPFVGLASEVDLLRPEVHEAVERVLTSRRFYDGPEGAALETEFAELEGARHAIAVNSGTSAILLAAQYLGVGPGDDVIAPNLTFIATIAPFVLLGCQPRLVDVDPDTLLIDCSRIKEQMTPRTRAIVPVSLHGSPLPSAELVDLSQELKVPLVVDACQSATGRTAAAFAGGATAVCYSLYCTKSVHAYGNGGMILTDNREAADWFRAARNHGRNHDRSTQTFFGLNLQLDEMQAAIARLSLRHATSALEERVKIARCYDWAFSDLPVRTPPPQRYGYHVYQTYALRVERRDEMATFLRARNIETGIHYLIPCSLQRAYSDRFPAQSFPVSEEACRTLLSLPIFAGMNGDQVDHVVRSVRSFFVER